MPDANVFPAPAGVSPAARYPPQHSDGVPRTRGGEPYSSEDWCHFGSCSPHPRG